MGYFPAGLLAAAAAAVPAGFVVVNYFAVDFAKGPTWGARYRGESS